MFELNNRAWPFSNIKLNIEFITAHRRFEAALIRLYATFPRGKFDFVHITNEDVYE